VPEDLPWLDLDSRILLAIYRAGRDPASDIYTRFVSSPVKPSRQLMSHVRQMVDNQRVFYLIDEQIATRNAIVSRAKRMARGPCLWRALRRLRPIEAALTCVARARVGLPPP